MIAEQMRESMSESRDQGHKRCVVCAPAHPQRLQVKYHVDAAGLVHAEFPCHRLFQGYPRQLHGSILAALLYGAMRETAFLPTESKL